MDPAGAAVAMVMPSVQRWVQAKVWWLLLLPLSGLTWLVTLAGLEQAEMLSTIRSGCVWLGISVPAVVEQSALWLQAPQREGVADLAAITAGVLASLSGRGSALGNGRGGQIGWLLLAAACLALDVRHALWLAAEAALIMLNLLWLVAWVDRVPSRSPRSEGGLQMLNPAGVFARWALGIFETLAVPLLPVMMAIGLVFQAFSIPAWPLKQDAIKREGDA